MLGNIGKGEAFFFFFNFFFLNLDLMDGVIHFCSLGVVYIIYRRSGFLFFYLVFPHTLGGGCWNFLNTWKEGEERSRVRFLTFRYGFFSCFFCLCGLFYHCK